MIGYCYIVKEMNSKKISRTVRLSDACLAVLIPRIHLRRIAHMDRDFLRVLLFSIWSGHVVDVFRSVKDFHPLLWIQILMVP